MKDLLLPSTDLVFRGTSSTNFKFKNNFFNVLSSESWSFSLTSVLPLCTGWYLQVCLKGLTSYYSYRKVTINLKGVCLSFFAFTLFPFYDYVFLLCLIKWLYSHYYSHAFSLISVIIIITVDITTSTSGRCHAVSTIICMLKLTLWWSHHPVIPNPTFSLSWGTVI